MADTYPHGGTYLLAVAVVEACHKSYCKAVEAIVKNGNLSPKDFENHKLRLSEAYCLLWQNAETGDVDGRTTSLYLKTGALATAIIDLFSLGKIDLVSDIDRLKKGKSNHLMVEVIDATPTGTYLDAAAFDQIVALTKERPSKPTRSLFAWLDKCDTSRCVNTTLKNLIDRGILAKEKSGLLGTFSNYPTLDSSEEESLVHAMKVVALKGEQPDSYMRALLVMTRTADDFYTMSDPILAKHFSKDEYKTAKAKIKELVESQ